MRSAFESQPTLLEARVVFTAIFIAGAVFVLGLQGKSFNEFAVGYEAWPEKPWLFLTTAFLHANFLHVGFNLYWMWGLGAQVEEQYGSLRTLGLLLLFAIGPAAAEWAFFGAGIGLSGVVYGWFGLRWALSRFHPAHRAAMPQRLVEMMVLWFFLCIALTYFDIMGIANVAHGVGGLLGFATGWALSPPRSNVPRFWERVATPARWGAVGALLLFFLTAATVGRGWVNLSPKHRTFMAFQEGVDAFEEGDLEQAIESFSDVVERDEGNADAWYNLGLSKGRDGQHAEAIRALNRALEIEPQEEDWENYRSSLIQTLRRSVESTGESR